MRDETATRVPCSEHPKWDWPHCGAAPADPIRPRQERPFVPGGPELMPVPEVAGEFAEAPELEEMAAQVITMMPELHWLGEYEVRVLWRAKGGAKLGVCTLARGLLRWFSRCHWVIWIAADHVAEGELTRTQVQALLYHELRHCDLVGPLRSPGIRKHDVEAFVGEAVRFGAWRPELEQLARALRMFEADTGGRADRSVGYIVEGG